MSNVKVQGNVNGSGSVTLTAPNTNSNRTVTLPDADVDLGNLGAQYTQAWINYNTSSSHSIRDDYNISSISDQGTGNTLLSFSSNMSSTNYVWNGNSAFTSANTPYMLCSVGSNYTLSTSQFQINTVNSTVVQALDSPLVMAHVTHS